MSDMQKFTNSNLVTYTKISSNKNSPRNHIIDTITIHCVVGQWTAKQGCDYFASITGASCNYVVGKDGSIGLCVDEKDRSWCSSSASNDHRAVTIEVASDTQHPYAVTDAAMKALIELVADICKRNNIKKLVWSTNKADRVNHKNGCNMTVHRDFANKSCVPIDSEVLTRDGWVSIKDIQIGDEIACADLDNLKISFEEVYDKVEEKKQDTYTNNGLTATKDHRMVYSTQRNKNYRKIDVYNKLLAKGSGVYIPMAGTSVCDGLLMSNEMMDFYIATQADGHYMYETNTNGEKKYYGLEFHFKKQRKIERIKEILDALHFTYSETHQSNGTVKIRIYNQDDINIVNDICEKYLENKCFTWQWLELSQEQAEHFIQEIQMWDGCKAAKLYTSKDRINLDIVSAIAATHNIGSNVTGDNIQFRDNPYMTLGEDSKRNNRGIKSMVTCVSVKTGIFLVRQDGKTFIIGNCPGEYLYSRHGFIANEVNKRLGATVESATSAAKKTLYRIRKTWTDAASQIGAYYNLASAQAQCDAAGPGYYVFDDKGNVVYPIKVEFKDGDQIKIGSGSRYVSGAPIPNWVIKSTLYYRGEKDNGDIIFSTLKEGAITGVVPRKYVTKIEVFKPYLVKVTADSLNIRKGPGTNYAIVGKITNKGIYTIVEEKSGQGATKWLKLKSGAGFISSDYVQKQQ